MRPISKHKKRGNNYDKNKKYDGRVVAEMSVLECVEAENPDEAIAKVNEMINQNKIIPTNIQTLNYVIQGFL